MALSARNSRGLQIALRLTIACLEGDSDIGMMALEEAADDQQAMIDGLIGLAAAGWVKMNGGTEEALAEARRLLAEEILEQAS